MFLGENDENPSNYWCYRPREEIKFNLESILSNVLVLLAALIVVIAIRTVLPP